MWRGLAWFALAYGTIKAATGVWAGVFVAQPEAQELWYRTIFAMVVLVVSVGAGALLAVTARRDQARGPLGALLVVVATPWADLLIGQSAAQVHPPAAIHVLQVDALTPLLLWRFATLFPFREPRSSRVTQLLALGVAVAAAAAVILVGTDLFLEWYRTHGISAPASLLTWSRDVNGPYWPFQFAVAGLALPLLIYRTRRANAVERRRGRLLLTGFVAAVAPTFIWQFVFSLRPDLADRVPFPVVAWPQYLGLVAAPLVSTYAVLADRAGAEELGGPRVARLAVHGLAVILAVGPVVGFTVWAYRYRDITVREVATSPRGMALAVWAVVGMWVFARLPRITARLRRVLGLGQGVDFAALAGFHDSLAAATGPHDVVLDFTRLMQRHLGATVTFAQASAPPTTPTAPPVGNMATQEVVGRAQVTHGWFTIVRPARSFDASELAFIEASASVVATSLDLLRREQATDAAPLAQGPGLECATCGRVHPISASQWCSCGGELFTSHLAPNLGGRYDVEQRIGGGVSGAVYRGRDRVLGRHVALKAPRHVAPDEIERFHAEARLLSQVACPSIVSIHDAITWCERPVLVLEFMEGGTLESRLAAGESWDWPTAAALVRRLAEGVRSLHESCILHGDIKPANIGFSASGVPKLLDLGLARIVTETGDAGHSFHSGEDDAGTRRYLAPERTHGAPPIAADDLWSLSVVLVEMVLGRAAMDRVPSRTPIESTDWRSLLDASGAPASMLAFAGAAMAPTRADRPRDGTTYLAVLCGEGARDTSGPALHSR